MPRLGRCPLRRLAAARQAHLFLSDADLVGRLPDNRVDFPAPARCVADSQADGVVAVPVSRSLPAPRVYGDANDKHWRFCHRGETKTVTQYALLDQVAARSLPQHHDGQRHHRRHRPQR